MPGVSDLKLMNMAGCQRPLHPCLLRFSTALHHQNSPVWCRLAFNDVSHVTLALPHLHTAAAQPQSLPPGPFGHPGPQALVLRHTAYPRYGHDRHCQLRSAGVEQAGLCRSVPACQGAWQGASRAAEMARNAQVLWVPRLVDTTGSDCQLVPGCSQKHSQATTHRV